MVFPLSLSEVAFTLVFLLMLLLGFMILSERNEREKAQAQVTALQQSQASTRAAEATALAMSQAQERLALTMTKAGAGTSEQVTQVIQEFVNVGRERAQRELLEQEVLDLTRKLTTLEEMRTRVEQVGRTIDEKLTRDEVERAMAMQTELVELIQSAPTAASSPAGAASGAASALVPSPNATASSASKPLDRQQVLERVRQAIATTRELREQAKIKLGVDVAVGQETTFARDVVEGARRAAEAIDDKGSPAALRQENATLRSQVTFYEKRDKLRGLDHPPCWMDADSKIEYAFNVHTTSAGFVVTRAWPSSREAQARAYVGVDDLMSNGGALSAGQFSRGAKAFLDYGKAQSPECRHFVYLSSSIAAADGRDNARRLVNSFFYVLERKTPAAP